MKSRFLLSLLLIAPIAGFADSCPVVDFGDDYAWHGGSQGLPQYRNGLPQDQRLQTRKDIDADGDGDATDIVQYHIFSMDLPLQPQEPGVYNVYGNNATFYGGLTDIFYGMEKGGWSEGGINLDHNGDDFNLHGYATTAGTAAQLYGVWMWKKEDFINGGDRHPVAFGPDSRMGVQISRYAKEYEELRFVVQEEGQFWISEFAPDFDVYELVELNPVETRWARYSPRAPWHIRFEPAGATFRPREFTNITAVGWFVAKHSKTMANCWLKWNAFSVDAVVDRPDTGGWTLPMRELTVEGEPLTVATEEVSYADWWKVYSWAMRNQYSLHPNFVFETDGDMGSMDRLEGAHTAAEPVTDITWMDAALWCNALSEREGREPVYYTNAAHTAVLRETRERHEPSNFGSYPTIYIKWAADGYRLPTLREWVVCARDGDGLAGMDGGVRELCWPGGRERSVYSPEQRVTALGASDLDPRRGPGGKPWFGHWAVGFRPVLRPAGGPAPASLVAQPEPSLKPRAWTFTPQTALPAQEPNIEMDAVAIPGGTFTREDEAVVHIAPFFMSRTEITYARYTRLLQWAEQNGYRFDRDGDMGSMDWGVDPQRRHRPDEPVTDIGRHDAMVWCNALSEYQGRTPVYYTDEARQQVYRTVFPFRENASRKDRDTPHGFHKDVTMRWDAGGWRLPTEDEFEYAARGGVEGQNINYWNEDGQFRVDDAYLWYLGNSGDRTHPVGRKKPNAYGLLDISGHVFEWVWGRKGADFFDNRNPRGDGIPMARSGSFRSPADIREPFFTVNGRPTHPFGKLVQGGAWPEVGFRIIRCEPGTHPAKEPPYVPDILFPLDHIEWDQP